MRNFRSFFLPTLCALAALLTYSAVATGSDIDDNFDRLDGKGESGVRVDVVEWEGNLEIHAYPAGSLKGLALKLDKSVMVIGYRFKDDPEKQLIRRAVLGIRIKDGFKAYRDPSESEFDKIIVSNKALTQVAAYKLEPAPTQLYPDEHPATLEAREEAAAEKARLAKKAAKPAAIAESAPVAPVPAPASVRQAAGVAKAKAAPQPSLPSDDDSGSLSAPAPKKKPARPDADEDGGISPFFGQ